MIHYVLFCILWSKPETKLIEVPVSEYAMASIEEDFGDFHFSADVFEEKMNSVKITHLKTEFSSYATSSRDYQQRSLYTKLELGDVQASLDCEMREKVQP